MKKLILITCLVALLFTIVWTAVNGAAYSRSKPVWELYETTGVHSNV